MSEIMQIVKFDVPYFAPSNPDKLHDGRAVQGVLYRKGVHHVPAEIPLPKSGATVLNAEEYNAYLEAKKREGGQELQLADFDVEQANADQLREINEEINAQEDYDEHEADRTKRGRGRPKKYE
jgi:hypothetical protein